MDEETLDRFREQLSSLRAELTQREQDLLQDSSPVELDQAKVGRLSRMDALQMQQMAMESSRRRQQQLGKVEAALKRINTEDYGFCLECGEEIDVRRLSIDPTHVFCIGCAEERSR